MRIINNCVYLHPNSGCSAVRLAHLLWEQGVPGSNPGTPTTWRTAELKKFCCPPAKQQNIARFACCPPNLHAGWILLYKVAGTGLYFLLDCVCAINVVPARSGHSPSLRIQSSRQTKCVENESRLRSNLLAEVGFKCPRGKRDRKGVKRSRF